MKSYCYGEPSDAVTRALWRMARKHKYMVWPAVIVAAIILVLVVVPAWILVKLGDIGHRVAFLVGHQSHDW